MWTVVRRLTPPPVVSDGFVPRGRLRGVQWGNFDRLDFHLGDQRNCFGFLVPVPIEWVHDVEALQAPMSTHGDQICW